MAKGICVRGPTLKKKTMFHNDGINAPHKALKVYIGETAVCQLILTKIYMNPK